MKVLHQLCQQHSKMKAGRQSLFIITYYSIQSVTFDLTALQLINVDSALHFYYKVLVI